MICCVFFSPTCLSVPLAAGQIHQVELALLDVLLPRWVCVLHLEPDGEDGVRARRVRVHGGGRGDAVGDAHPQQLGAVSHRLHVVHRQVLDVGVVALDLQLPARVLAEQVADLLVVDLDVGDVHRVPGVAVLVGLLALEDVDDGARDDADVVGVLLHGEALARPRLPVGHDGGVVPLEDALHQRVRDLVVDLLGGGVRGVAAVERERDGLVGVVRLRLGHGL